jgi:hypothetical protein
MSSSSKKRQTMAKMTRERLVKEKRALKAEKREAKKQAAADARQAEATGIPIAPEIVDDAALPDA